MTKEELEKVHIDVIIPTYKPGRELGRLLDRINRQSKVPDRIIIINSDESSWTDMELPGNAELHHIDINDFDHGATRNYALSFSSAGYFVMMTQDVSPADDRLFENLISPMNESVRMTYARQLSKKNAGDIERITRGFNYPDKSRVKNSDDLKTLGIKAFFVSDSCAAYERKLFDELGGFDEKVIMAEDAIYASKLIKKGYEIKYCANAQVFHSHNYSAAEQFRRNFDNGVTQAMHPETYGGISSESEGLRLVRTTGAQLIKENKAYRIPELIWVSGMKYLGFRAGKSYKSIPETIRKKMSYNKNFWK